MPATPACTPSTAMQPILQTALVRTTCKYLFWLVTVRFLPVCLVTGTKMTYWKSLSWLKSSMPCIAIGTFRAKRKPPWLPPCILTMPNSTLKKPLSAVICKASIKGTFTNREAPSLIASKTKSCCKTLMISRYPPGHSKPPTRFITRG